MTCEIVNENQLEVRLVNWHEECLDGNNNGLIHGVYLYDDDEIVRQEWFKSKHERNKWLKG